mgnify:CR=1 FL=1|tara:strand:+ start:3939 stop:4817 length:879 start_codon:yes stop_codon:yes gene_type:complete
MAYQLKTTLKGYFQSGNIPVEQHYIDIIDSALNLSENNPGNIDLTGNITASGTLSLGGDVSSSGDFTIRTISASSYISCSALTSSGISVLGHITASGNIKCGNFDVGGTVNADNATYTTLAATNLSLGGTTLTTTFAELNYLDGLTSGEATQIKNIGSNAISNTEWSYVSNMNQNVATTSQVQFSGITLTKASAAGGTYGGTIHAEGQSFTLTLLSCPEIPGRASGLIAKSAPTTIINPQVLVTSVVLATVASAELSVNAFRVSNGTFEISLGNEAAGNFGGGNVVINFTIF